VAVAFFFGVWNLFGDGKLRLYARWIIGVWALVELLAALLLTPLEWQRYYLMAYPIIGIIAAIGVSHLLNDMYRMIQRVLQRIFT